MSNPICRQEINNVKIDKLQNTSDLSKLLVYDLPGIENDNNYFKLKDQNIITALDIYNILLSFNFDEEKSFKYFKTNFKYSSSKFKKFYSSLVQWLSIYQNNKFIEFNLIIKKEKQGSHHSRHFYKN